MAINLLPEEEKSKLKPTKRQSVTHIQMTGPAKLEKKKPAVKQSGILTFFKQVFQKPEEEAKDLKFPEKKVRIIQRQSRAGHIQKSPQPSVPPRKKVVFQQPSKEGMRLDNHRGILKKIFDLLKSLFGKPAKPSKNKSKGEVIPQEKKAFPKYSPVKTEKIKSDKHLAVKSGEEIHVVTQYESDKKSKVFSATASISPEPPLEPILENSVTSPLASETRKGIPARPLEKIELEKKLPESKKSQTDNKFLPAPHKKRKPFRLTAWLKKFWKSIKGIFQRKPKQPLPLLAPKLEKKPVVSAEQKKLNRHYVLEHEKQIGKKIISETVPVSPATAPARQESAGDEKKISPLPLRETKPVVSPSLPSSTRASLPETLPHSPSAAESEAATSRLSEEKGMKMTKPVRDMKPALQWEVNLIPEDAVEVRVPLSKLLIMAAFMVVAVGIVFGGWAVADWYYNNITTEISEINQEIAMADIQINQKQTLIDEVRRLNQEIQHVTNILEEHVYWSPLFTQLETYTTPDVYYTSMTADVNGFITLAARGRNYEAAIKQLMVFKNTAPFVKTVAVENITFASVDETTTSTAAPTTTEISERPVQFSIQLSVDPKLFYYQTN